MATAHLVRLEQERLMKVMQVELEITAHLITAVAVAVVLMLLVVLELLLLVELVEQV
jgi:hypothetical protein